MSNFNKIIKAKEKDINKENQERLDRCSPIAQQILEMMAVEKLPIGEINDKQGRIKDDVKTRYMDFASKILVLMLKSEIKYSERTFLFNLIQQILEQSREMVINSVERSFSRVNEEKWGKDEMDINMKDIHDILINIGK
jgi:hypothetical protein